MGVECHGKVYFCPVPNGIVASIPIWRCESESGPRNLNSLCDPLREKENGSVVSAAADPCSEMETLVRRIRVHRHHAPPFSPYSGAPPPAPPSAIGS